MSECLICKEEAPNLPPFGCNHHFCTHCSQEYIKLLIAECKVMKMHCPLHNCPYQITDDDVLRVVGTEFYNKYKLFLRNSELSLNPNLRFCPKPDCQGYDIGSSKKHKLLCNSCGFEFCYYCNEGWHIGITCKNSQDIKFDQWSTHHDVKYCPNCRRRIEKAGGCPSMECPVCKSHWCWYCGKDLANGHDPILCVFMKESWDFRYWFVLFLIFGPVTIPFGFGMFLIHLGQNYLTDSDKESKFVARVIKWKILTYPLIILLSPALTVFLLLGSGFFVIYINRIAFKPYSTGCYSKTFRHKCPRLFLMLVLGFIVSGVLTSIILIGIVVTPIIGIGFFIAKVRTDINDHINKRNTNTSGYVEI